MSFVIGAFNWADLTVSHTESIRDFYAKVIGYQSTPVNMGDYNDYCMNSPTDQQTKTGICHNKGVNENLPPVWLIYFNVQNLQQSLEDVLHLGGKIIQASKAYGDNAKYAVIQDPAGAFCALYEETN